MTYILAKSSTALNLQKKVQALLDKGCCLYGSPFSFADPGPTKEFGFCQALTYEGNPEDLRPKPED